MRNRFLQHILLCCVLTVSAYGKARWNEMDTGKSESDVFKMLGAPLIMHGGRGYMQWTYDAGGAVMFRQGIVIYWNTPVGYTFVPEAPKPIPPVVKAEPVPVAAAAVAAKKGPDPELLELATLDPDSYDPHAAQRNKHGPAAFVAVRTHR